MSTSDLEANKAIYSRLVDHLINARDYGVIDDVVAPDVHSHDPFPGVPPGSEGLRKTFEIFHGAFPDLHAEIEDLIAEGDKVVARLRATGTHRGEFMGQAPTGGVIDYAEVVIVRIAGGRIVEHWAVADALALMQQIGAIPQN
jgi:predicted ester cyclase